MGSVIKSCQRCGTGRPYDEFEVRSHGGRFCIRCCRVKEIVFNDTQMLITTKSDTVLTVPIEKYKLLYLGSDEQRRNWKLNRDGWGIHWPDLDEDLSLLSDL